MLYFALLVVDCQVYANQKGISIPYPLFFKVNYYIHGQNPAGLVTNRIF
jgi:hypothetical protein